MTHDLQPRRTDFTLWIHSPNISAGGSPDSPARISREFTVPRPTTGTKDDDDDPEDEHPGKNEASERERNVCGSVPTS
jgi:hypothetical protein